MTHFKYVIIGAGLSGLTSAYYLNKLGESNYLVLESRDRIGGRIFTKNGIDLGATWFQNHHEMVVNFLNELQLESFDQYSKGKSILLYDPNRPVHYFESDPNAQAAKRIKGNSVSLIRRLSQSSVDKIKLYTIVQEIIDKGDHLKIVTNKETFTASKVILTIPPKLVSQLQFTPDLNISTKKILASTPTWMEHSIKVGITYEKAFWRNKNFSGTLIGQSGAVTELYDHCDPTTGIISLMGFVSENLREQNVDQRKKIILDYIANQLGTEVYNYLNYEENDWSKDPNTSNSLLTTFSRTHNYGHPVMQESIFNDKLIFSGTETSQLNAGYMDGAIYSGIRSAAHWNKPYFSNANSK
ncbi:flavin monoamine oxidase family protein [Nonlabens sp.]|uniref:flavin monoamine oxidase family protein n=1 Tax=Nonlabens sp. TaxID=1888209 RepID=UPI003F6A1D57